MRRMLVVCELHQVFRYQLRYNIIELVVLSALNEVLERMRPSTVRSYLIEQRKGFLLGLRTHIFVFVLKRFE